MKKHSKEWEMFFNNDVLFSVLHKPNKIKKPPPRREPFLCGYMLFKRSVGSLNLTGTQTSCADVYSARSAVNDSLNLLYIGLKASVRASVWVRNLNTESDTFTADIAFCHGWTPPFQSIYYKYHLIIADVRKKIKYFLQFFSIFLF